MVKPFSMGLHSAAQHDEHIVTEDSMGASDKLLARSTTSLIRGCAGLVFAGL